MEIGRRSRLGLMAGVGAVAAGTPASLGHVRRPRARAVTAVGLGIAFALGLALGAGALTGVVASLAGWPLTPVASWWAAFVGGLVARAQGFLCRREVPHARGA